MNAKKALLVLALVFLGFWMFRDPHGLADRPARRAGAVWDGTTQLFEATIRFLDELALGPCDGTDPARSRTRTSASTCCATRVRSSSTRCAHHWIAYLRPCSRRWSRSRCWSGSRSWTSTSRWFPFLVAVALLLHAGWRTLATTWTAS